MKNIQAYQKFLMIPIDEMQYQELDGNPNLTKCQEKTSGVNGNVAVVIYPKGCISSGLGHQLNRLIKLYKTGK